MANSYDKYLQSSGGSYTPQQYAGIIQQKQASRQTLDDPAAAQAFQQANPQYFTGASTTATPANPIPGYTAPTKTAATNPIPGYTPNAQAQAALTSVQPTNAPTATPAVQPATQTSQQNLSYYGSGTQAAITAANAAIAQLGQIYNQAMASGNTAAAQAAHTQANQIRQAMGQQAGTNYNQTTGAPITQQTQPAAPTTQQPLATGITANTQAGGFNTSDGAYYPDYQSALTHQDQITATPPSAQTSADSVLTQMNTLIQQMNNYNPQSDPEYQTMVNAATQSVMESMASRGILNSTVTADQVSQAMAPVISDLTNAAYQRFQTQLTGLNDLYNSYAGEAQQQTANALAQQQMTLTQQQDNITDALNTIKSLGYVDNQSSITLGIPVNTPTSDAQQFAQSELDKINIAIADNQEKLQAAQVAHPGKSTSTGSSSGSGTKSSSGTASETAAEQLDESQAAAEQSIESTWQQLVAQGNPSAGVPADPTGKAAYNYLHEFIINNADSFTAQGVDPQTMLNYLDMLYTGKAS
jgi:hypothetical protein